VHELVTLFETLWQIVLLLGSLLVQLLGLLLQTSLLLVWLAWALLAVNWPKAWQVLRQGAWAPFVLLLVFIAVVWSQLMPADCNCLHFVTLPNFWWQLGTVGMFAALTLGCGWLQGLLGWTPETINLEPAAEAHHHGHDHHH